MHARRAGLAVLALLAGCRGPAIETPGAMATGVVEVRFDGDRLVQAVPGFSGIRLVVDGLGMAQPRMATASLGVSQATVTLSGIPAGPNRVIVLDGLAADGTPLKAAHWAGLSTVLAGRTVTATLDAATTPAGEVVAQLLVRDRQAGRDEAHAASRRVDADQLVATLTQQRARLAVAHPVLFDVAAIAEAIFQDLPSSSTAAWDPTGVDWAAMVRQSGRVRLTLAGLPVGAVASASLDDPISPVQQNLTAGDAWIEPVAPGTWTLRAEAPGGLKATCSVSVSAASPAAARLDLGRWQPQAVSGTLPTGAAWATMSLGGQTQLVLAGGSDGLPGANGTVPYATDSCRAFDGTSLKSLPNLPVPLAYAAGCVQAGKFYLLGGMKSDLTASSAVYAFDGQRWSGPVAAISISGTVVALAGSVAAPINGKVVLVGGTSRRFAQALDPATNTFSYAVAPLTHRVYPASVLYGGYWYLFGGNSDRGFTDSVERYNPAINQWKELAAMPVPRYGAQAVAAGGRLYLIGGMETDGRSSARVDVYDPQTDAWAGFPALNQARGGVSLGFLQDRVYVLGGGDGLFYQFLNASANAAHVPVPTNALEVLTP